MHDAGERDSQRVAEEAGRLFQRHDRATFAFFGFELVAMAPGRATVRFAVGPAHLNSAGVCHGGIVFALADSALGLASCSRGEQTLAQHADIHWLKPALPGDTLTATAREISRGRRTVVCDVEITNQVGETVAALRGLTRGTGAPVGAGRGKG